MRHLSEIQQNDKRTSLIKIQIQKDKGNGTRFKVIEGISYHQNGMTYRAYAPQDLIKTLIWECHFTYGHCGPDKTYRSLREYFYYPRFAKIVRQTLSTCDSCQRNKISTTASQALQEPVLPKRPLEMISMEFFGPLTASTFGS